MQNWRRMLESLCLSLGTILVGLLLFGVFRALVGANPFVAYGLIWKAAFGSASTFQNTLIRASPLMLSALCTALPARLGLVLIGNEGALVMGGAGGSLHGTAHRNSAAAAVGANSHGRNGACRWGALDWCGWGATAL